MNSVEDKFFESIEKIPIAGCWIWMKCLADTGYGNLRIRNKTFCSHRISWLLFNGHIPKGMHVLHYCDVRECCNPSHLWLGTNLDNILDRCRKGRSVGPSYRPKGLKYKIKSNHGEWNLSLSKIDRENIRIIYASGGISTYELAKRYSVSQPTISNIINRKTKW